jgi:CRP-like cAMP-binding protein
VEFRVDQRFQAESTVRNRLLRRLPADELSALLPLMRPVEISARQVLHHWNLPMEHVYFIESGLVSVSAKIGGDRSVEAWLIGSEGMTGISVLLEDADNPPHRRVVQVAGRALQISASDLRRAFAERPRVRNVLLRYVQVVLLQTSQSGACNAQHSVQQRLARWLLVAVDALGTTDLPLTHQVLGQLLGIRRPSVTECLAVLEGNGGLRNTRGHIEINDPEALQAQSCACYRIIKRDYARLLGPEASLIQSNSFEQRVPPAHGVTLP